jgi:hypothetical protein
MEGSGGISRYCPRVCMEIKWKWKNHQKEFIVYVLMGVCGYRNIQILNQLKDFHETRYKYYAVGSHSKV